MKKLSLIAVLVITLAGCALALASSAAHASDAWAYTQSADKMTGKAEEVARLQSTNSLDLPFPYGGYNFGYLMVRQSARWGLDVLVSINKGQILCPSYSGCSVRVRFGDGKPVTFSANPPSDMSSDTVFLGSVPKFVAGAKGTNKIKVELTLYQSGSQVLEFESVAPLVWGAKPAKK